MVLQRFDLMIPLFHHAFDVEARCRVLPFNQGPVLGIFLRVQASSPNLDRRRGVTDEGKIDYIIPNTSGWIDDLQRL
jgi:hypothetical protein